MLSGIVCGIRHAAEPSGNTYYITSLEGPMLHELKSSIVLHLGEQVEAEVFGELITSAIINQDGPALKMCLDAVRLRASKLLIERELSQSDRIERITINMQPKLNQAAQLLLEKLYLGAPVIVRFHNDADGATGAYGLYLSINQILGKICQVGSPKIFWKMHRSVSYTLGDSREDLLTIGNYDSVAKPLLLITDFGTSEESLQGAALANEKFDIIWLDHHPVLRELAEMVGNYINPWMFGGDSNYTAGMLTCEFGKSFASIDLSLIEKASLIGDYSGYAVEDKGARGLALLLDMLTSDKRIAFSSGGDITPMEIDQILRDESRSAELIRYATTRLEEAIDSGLEGLKHYKSEIGNIYVLDFENVRKDAMTKYPLPGRYASKLLERIEKEGKGPSILVLHFGHFVSIRVSGEISGRVGLLRIVGGIKSDYDYVEAAGGHNNAASIKLRSEEYKKEAINTLLRGFGCSIL
ncbi:MAG: hypothetical protein KGH61_01525 [Candidatus Micrarchaeota archaeon]|nr:hypothetical protein [Candidatus Micrarchaeota archaeon]MDE1847611.1 hypothetical protein [Candidatus Micrarchaeota archaeon]MDE1863814.1 hypothetical protein [Candidatus Micrarchaeota archaeon]